ncbi:MAG: hypothetical protein MZV65_34845, partial [Chromatiales bacterium]|nr:hypothetical protein [Chromatiales bacterium]
MAAIQSCRFISLLRSRVDFRLHENAPDTTIRRAHGQIMSTSIEPDRRHWVPPVGPKDGDSLIEQTELPLKISISNLYRQ